MTVCIYKITNDRTRMNEKVVVRETFTGDANPTRVNGPVKELYLQDANRICQKICYQKYIPIIHQKVHDRKKSSTAQSRK